MSWDRATYQARVADETRRVRHPAASPDPTEVAAYRQAAEAAVGDLGGANLVVLGATPELRLMGLAAGAQVVAVDHSPLAWEVFADWVDDARERRVEGSWEDLAHHVGGQVEVIVGDGVIGNLPSLDAAATLLTAWRSVLGTGGVLILRQALVPDALDTARDAAPVLLDRHRAGELDPAEFGFGVRIVGHLATCWDPSTGLLDGRAVYEAIDAWAPTPALSEAERSAIARYVYRGTNLVPAASAWEATVAAAGFTMTTMALRGRDWYRYYPVQVLAPEP